MGYNNYTGSRYVPKVHGIDDEWSKNKSYEALEVVPFQGASFTSRKAVPIGIDILNTDFWVCTGNYNVQVENYRQETNNAVENVNLKLDTFTNTLDGKFQIILNGYKQQINSYADGKYAGINSDVTTLTNNLNEAKNQINSAISNYENVIEDKIEDYTQTVNNQISQVQNLLVRVDLVFDEGTSTDIDTDDMTIIDEGVV